MPGFCEPCKCAKMRMCRLGLRSVTTNNGLTADKAASNSNL